MLAVGKCATVHPAARVERVARPGKAMGEEQLVRLARARIRVAAATFLTKFASIK
jgi:hypothetical protein